MAFLLTFLFARGSLLSLSAKKQKTVISYNWDFSALYLIVCFKHTRLHVVVLYCLDAEEKK